MAFEERNFVDPQSRERRERIPINASGDPAEIDDPVEDGQMPQEPRLVHAVALADGTAAAAAGGTGERAFDRQDELAILGQLGLEDTDIRDVEGIEMSGCLGIRDRPSRTGKPGGIVPNLDSRCNPTSRSNYGKSQRTEDFY